MYAYGRWVRIIFFIIDWFFTHKITNNTSTNPSTITPKTNGKKNLIESVGGVKSAQSSSVPEKINDIQRGSVLEKMSIFEQASKQAAAAAAPPSIQPLTTNTNVNSISAGQLSSGRSSNSISSGESIYSNRKDDINKTNNSGGGSGSGSISDKDPGNFK